MWIPLILTSAAALGFYDVCRKHALNTNAVLPVLWLATCCGSVAILGVFAATGQLQAALAVSAVTFWRVMLKAAIVTASWVFEYYAMRSLPISIAAPIRASQPVWTVSGAFLLFNERPAGWQWLGIAVIFTGYYLFSVLGQREGIDFRKHRGIFCIFAGTLLGAASGLYDKFLLQNCQIPPVTLQAWFSLDLVLLIGLVLLVQRGAALNRTAFQWRWSIPAVGLLLVGSDYCYFSALSLPGTQISVLSLIRRSNCTISFAVGGAIFKDQNRFAKLWALVCILAGVALLCLTAAKK